MLKVFFILFCLNSILYVTEAWLSLTLRDIHKVEKQDKYLLRVIPYGAHAMNPNCITKCEDPEAQDTKLMKTLNNNYFSYFPTKIVKIRSLDKPFITMGLKGLSRGKK